MISVVASLFYGFRQNNYKYFRTVINSSTANYPAACYVQILREIPQEIAKVSIISVKMERFFTRTHDECETLNVMIVCFENSSTD